MSVLSSLALLGSSSQPCLTCIPSLSDGPGEEKYVNYFDFKEVAKAPTTCSVQLHSGSTAELKTLGDLWEEEEKEGIVTYIRSLGESKSRSKDPQLHYHSKVVLHFVGWTAEQQQLPSAADESYGDVVKFAATDWRQPLLMYGGRTMITPLGTGTLERKYFKLPMLTAIQRDLKADATSFYVPPVAARTRSSL